MKTCNQCGDEKGLGSFPRDRHGHKNTCKICYTMRESSRQQARANRRFNTLIRASFVALFVLAIFSHDMVDGRNRICFYESVYGLHAFTIDSMTMCPLTWEVGNGF